MEKGPQSFDDWLPLQLLHLMPQGTIMLPGNTLHLFPSLPYVKITISPKHLTISESNMTHEEAYPKVRKGPQNSFTGQFGRLVASLAFFYDAPRNNNLTSDASTFYTLNK